MDETHLGKTGFWFAKGFFLYAGYLCALYVLIVMTYNIARWCTGWGIDDSDESSWNRSNLEVFTDYKTGVQYVGSRNGLTVRLDQNGKQMVVRRQARYHNIITKNKP